VTGGWQGNEGGWQQQPDPYGQPQYGPPYDPYGQYQQDPSGGQAYPAYVQGFGAPPPPPPPPPPKRSKLPIVLSLVAIVAVVGGVVAIVLLNRNDDPQPVANTGPGTSTSQRSASPPKVPPLGTTKKPPSSGAQPPPKEGWVRVDLADGTGSYEVPGGWNPQPEKKDSGLSVQFGDGTEFGTYNCGGHSYFRGFSASSEVQSKTGAEVDVNKAVTDFANSFAGKYYNGPKIDLPAPTSTTVGGKKAAMVTAKLTVQPTNPECEATSGEVAVLGVAVGAGGVRVLVVVNDLDGGPATPKPLPDPLAEQILGTLSLK
jgi:hypothetical protein